MKMTDNLIELSSDDDNNFDESTNNIDLSLNIQEILTKYKHISDDVDVFIKPSKETISSSSTDTEIDEAENLKSLHNKLRMKYNLFNSQSDEKSCNTDKVEVVKPKRRKNINEEKILKETQKGKEKIQKQAEKEKIKAANTKAKAEKQALASAYRNLKPDECLKFIVTLIDIELLSMECGIDIPKVLQETNINYKIESNLYPHTVTWKRNRQPQLTQENGEVKIVNNEGDCEEVLLLLIWNEFVKIVSENKLCSTYKDLLQFYPNRKIFFGIYGMANYFKVHKKQKLNGKEKIYLDVPKVSRKDVDMSLIELQLLFGVSHRFVETPEEVSSMVLQFTKSIAQIPYKLHKQSKQQEMEWFISGDNKDCVKVDKNGNGLYRLWQQQLMQFSMARLETAEAIASKYPSPSSLIKAYEECETVEDGEKLLQDIPIRRAAGPLTSVRKIGPELSRKVYNLFTATNGEKLL